MTQNKSENIFFPALTGYRAIAAWMVFIYHFFPYDNPAVPPVLKNVAVNLDIGVDFFFILSGFLITIRYFNSKNLNLKKYLLNRFARIYPLFLILIICTYLLKQNFSNTEFLLNLTLTKTFFKPFLFTGIMQAWTLTLEEIFYFSAPLFFILVRRSMVYFLLLPLLILAVGFGLKSVFSGNTYGFMQFNFSVYIIEFFTGIFIAKNLRLIMSKRIKFTLPGIFFLLCFLLFSNTFRMLLDIPEDLFRLIEIIFLSVFCIAPILLGLIKEKTFLSKLLSTKLFIVLGKSSYAFYLIHIGFIANLVYINISENKIVIFIILNFISVVIYKYIEEPLNLYIRKIGNEYTR